MNYYIQGCAAKADKIRAAFKAKGINTSDWAFVNPCDLYFNVGSEIYTIDYSVKHIVTGRHDYTHLELQVEPKFKVGDSLQSGSYWARIRRIDAENRRYICDFDNVIPFEEQELWSLVPNSKPHYDIANFKPFDKVLVRDNDDERWMAGFYGFYAEESHYAHFVGTRWSKQCIPFNEDTKHLLGTTDMCDERFINW